MSSASPLGAPSHRPDPADPSLARLLLAFAAVYLIWGSTYLAIRFAIETMPPFTMAGVRFLSAGALLYLWARSRGAPNPTRRQVRDGAVIGAFLLLGGNGAVVWAEQWVPSGLVALLVATVPLWMVLIDWGWGDGERPSIGVALGLVQGLVGVAWLTGGLQGEEFGPRAMVGGVVVLLGALSWAVGSIVARTAQAPAAPRMATATQMLAGGAMLLVVGGGAGEWSGFAPAQVSAASWLALAYLVVFGALVGYSAYIWLLGVTTAARVSTYAYVNPVVALVLGWALADEPLTPRTLGAAAVILSAVLILNRLGRRRRVPVGARPVRS
ncbi:EamA family transporter [Gaopeijia maritima]|uniref:EamA family transporter n=1 Tax=Gaopeijia maritima TaxID=3119007 RepID=A0ABU9EBY1_9BACT